MTSLIEKLEELEFILHCSETDAFTRSYVRRDDVRAIIESAKSESQEPVAWLAYQGTFQMIADTKDKLPDSVQSSAIPLFTHPTLSDATVKDAARWNKLISYIGAHTTESGAQNFYIVGLSIHDDVNLMRGSVSGHLTKIIDEAMKAENVSE